MSHNLQRKILLQIKLLSILLTIFIILGCGGSSGGSDAPAPQPPAPDLVVSSFTANPTTINSGGTVSLSAKVRNIGNLTADSITLQYYRSQNNITNDSPNNLVTTYSISRISANSSSDATHEVTGHGSGIYYYWACAAVSGETNTANNCSPSTIPVTAIVGAAWQQSTASADWTGRYAHSSVVFNNKMWVLGGFGGSYRNDVWSSSNGNDWTEATDGSERWSARYSHSFVAFDNKMWVLGGIDGRERADRKNDVWSSVDGTNWTRATSDAGWSGRLSHSSVVFDNKIWVLGGTDVSSRTNDVWSSVDGTNWTEATDGSRRWSARNSHTSIAFDNKIWVLGGLDGDGNRYNDVWSSVDGTSWTEATDGSARWSARNAHTSTVFDNKIWVLGGSDGNNRHNDVWSSENGTSWTEVTASADWTARYVHTSIAFDNKIWVLGGTVNLSGRTFPRNDVWFSGINNNSFDRATSLDSGSKSFSSYSAILTAGASDFYRVSLTAGNLIAGNWTFSTQSGIDLACELYNSSNLQTPLFQDNNGGNCSVAATITTANTTAIAGDYYIVVKGMTNSITGNYTLKVTAP